jgi:hypothetical protein
MICFMALPVKAFHHAMQHQTPKFGPAQSQIWSFDVEIAVK